MNHADPRGLYSCLVIGAIYDVNEAGEAISLWDVECSSEGHTLTQHFTADLAGWPGRGDASKATKDAQAALGLDLDQIEQSTTLIDAVTEAKMAFRNKPCRDLFFANADPSDVLDHLVAGDGRYGSIGWSDLGARQGAAVTTVGRWTGTGYTSAVTLNSNGEGDWFAPSQGYGPYSKAILNAKTLIHELGHVFENMFGPASTKILDDSAGGSVGNSEFVMQECFGRKPW